MLNFQAPANQWQNNGVPLMASQTSAVNFIRPQMQPYSKMISGHLVADLNQTANANPLRQYLYTIATQSQYNNQTFIAMIQMACMLAEYAMACNRLNPDAAIMQACVSTNQYFAARMASAPEMQGRIDANIYTEANTVMNNMNPVIQAATAYIQSSPVTQPQQMMNGMQPTWGQQTMVDPRFANPMQGMSQFTQPMNMGMQQMALPNSPVVNNGMGGFQTMGGAGMVNNNPMVIAAQTPVKVTEGVLQKQQPHVNVNTTAPINVVVPKEPINKVTMEIGSNKPNPFNGLLPNLPSASHGSKVVLGSVTTPVETSITQANSSILLYTDDAYDPDVRYGGFGTWPILINPKTDIGYIDLTSLTYGVSSIGEHNVDYSKHRNYHLLKSRGKHGVEPDNDKFIEAIQHAAVITDIKTTLAALEKERNAANIDKDTAIEYAATQQIHLGLVPILSGDYHCAAYAFAEENGITLDMDSSAVRMTVVTPRDWFLDKNNHEFINKLENAGRWSDIYNEMIALRTRIPLYIWHDIDLYMLNLFNEINMIEMDSGVFIDDCFTESILEAGKDVLINIGKENINLYLNRALDLFKSRVCFANASEYDSTVNKDSEMMCLTTYEDITLLPVESKDVLLASPSDVGVIDASVTPALYGLVDLTFKSLRKGVRWVKFITVDRGVLHIYKTFNGEYAIATKTVFE